MTITHDDFFRLLPKALAHYQYNVAGNVIQVKVQKGGVAIHLQPETSRSSGALQLPVTHVAFYFENVLPDKMQQFLATFDRAYQKGGG